MTDMQYHNKSLLKKIVLQSLLHRLMIVCLTSLQFCQDGVCDVPAVLGCSLAGELEMMLVDDKTLPTAVVIIQASTDSCILKTSPATQGHNQGHMLLSLSVL